MRGSQVIAAVPVNAIRTSPLAALGDAAYAADAVVDRGQDPLRLALEELAGRR